MSVFSARDELVAVPSCPELLTKTVFVGPGIDTLLIPETNALVCFPAVPIRIRPDSSAVPSAAMSTLFDPVVRLSPALPPSAMFEEPAVL
jgi:hypothetical protein